MSFLAADFCRILRRIPVPPTPTTTSTRRPGNLPATTGTFPIVIPASEM